MASFSNNNQHVTTTTNDPLAAFTNAAFGIETTVSGSIQVQPPLDIDTLRKEVARLTMVEKLYNAGLKAHANTIQKYLDEKAARLKADARLSMVENRNLALQAKNAIQRVEIDEAARLAMGLRAKNSELIEAYAEVNNEAETLADALERTLDAGIQYQNAYVKTQGDLEFLRRDRQGILEDWYDEQRKNYDANAEIKALKAEVEALRAQMYPEQSGHAAFQVLKDKQFAEESSEFEVVSYNDETVTLKRREPWTRLHLRHGAEALGYTKLIDQHNPFHGKLVDEPMYLYVPNLPERKVDGDKQRAKKRLAKARKGQKLVRDSKRYVAFE